MQAGNTIYVSGQLGVDAQGKLVSNDVVDQTRQALANMRQVLSMAGADMSCGEKCFDGLPQKRYYRSGKMHSTYERLG